MTISRIIYSYSCGYYGGASGLVALNDTMELIRFPGGYFDRALQAHYYVTDYQGNNIAVLPHRIEARPEQSMSYYPYGEPHRRPTASGSPSASTQNRYLFADKEYTDFGGESHSDFGPRTLNLPIPFFATQDNHADNRPEESPFVYCGGNPIMNIDPTGNDTYTLDSIGYIISLERNNKFDAICVRTDDGDKKIWSGNYGVIQKAYRRYEGKKREYLGEYFVVSNDKDGVNIFEALAQYYTGDNRHAEWSILKTGDVDAKNQLNYIMTSHEENTERMARRKFMDLVETTLIRAWYHSHPSNTRMPSGIPSNRNPKKSGDIRVAEIMTEKAGYDIEFKMYRPGPGKYVNFTPRSTDRDILLKNK